MPTFKPESIRGVITAMVTPFKPGTLEVDVDQLKIATNWQIENGVDALVPVGTTGESPTLTKDEKKLVITTVLEAAAGRVPVIAGTGSNNTKESVEFTQWAKDAGCDACLVVSPYYNKPTQEGIYQHYAAVAEVGLPVVLYNVPGRTAGAGIAASTTIRLSALPAIVAIKEASGNLGTITEIHRACDLIILSGDDGLTLPMITVGAVGVISVLSNVSVKLMTDIVHKALAGDFASALVAHDFAYEAMCNNFIESNPIPAKYCMSILGLCGPEVRLPLTPITEKGKETMMMTMKNAKLL